MPMETLMEDLEYNWADVNIPPIEPQPELARESRERRRGRDIVIAIDHGPTSKHAFDWAIVHLCRLADTIHLVHAVSSLKNGSVCAAAEERMEKFAVEAMNVAMRLKEVKPDTEHARTTLELASGELLKKSL